MRSNLNDLIIDSAAGTVTATLTGDFGGPVGPVDETVFTIVLASILVTTPALDSTNWLGGLDPVVPNGFAFGILTNPDTTVVPLPAALPLLLSALSVLGFFGWRRRRVADQGCLNILIQQQQAAFQAAFFVAESSVLNAKLRPTD